MTRVKVVKNVGLHHDRRYRRRGRRRFAIAGLIVITLGVAATSTSVFAVQWSTYHWPSDVNQLDVDDNTNSDFTADVATAVSQWNDVMPGAGPQMNINGGADIEIRSKNMSAFYLGVAEILVEVDTGHILEGRVTLNLRYLKDGNLYGYTPADRLHVACQEIGHILGLDHHNGASA